MPKGQPKKPRIQGDKLPEEQIKILKSIELEIKKTSLFLKNIKGEKTEKVESEEVSETPLTDIKDAIIKTSGDFSKSFSRVANKITEINKNILTLVNDKKKNDKNLTGVAKPKLSTESAREQAVSENQKLELVKKQTTTLQDIKDILENKYSGGGSAKSGGIGDMLGGIASMIGKTAFGGIMATILGIVGAGAAVLLTAAVAGGLGYTAFKLLLEPMMNEAQEKKNKVFAEKEDAKIKDILTDTGETVYDVEGNTPDDSRVMSSGQIQKELNDPKTNEKRKAQLENALKGDSLKIKTDAKSGIQTGGRTDIKSGQSTEEMNASSAAVDAGRMRDPKSYAYKALYDQIVMFDEETRTDWEKKKQDPDADLPTVITKYKTKAASLYNQIKASKLNKDQEETLQSLSPLLEQLGMRGNLGDIEGAMGSDDMNKYAARDRTTTAIGIEVNPGQSDKVKTRLEQLKDMGKADEDRANSGKKPSNTPQPKAPITAGAEGQGDLIGIENSPEPVAPVAAPEPVAPVLKDNTKDDQLSKEIKSELGSRMMELVRSDDVESRMEAAKKELGWGDVEGAYNDPEMMHEIESLAERMSRKARPEIYETASHKNEAIYEGSPQGSKVIVGEDNASEVILSTNPNKITKQIAENLRQSMGGSDASSTERSSSVILDALQNSLAEYVEMFKISPLQGNQQGNQVINNTVVSGGGGGGVNAQYNPSMMDTSNSENILQELLKNSYRAALL